MLIVTILISSCLLYTSASITEYLDISDKKKLSEVLKKGFAQPNKTDFANPYYATNGFTNLNEAINTGIKTETCSHLEANFNNALNSESIYQALSTWSLLKCNDVSSKKDKKLHTSETTKVLKGKLENQGSTIADIRFALEGLKLLGEATPNPTAVAQSIQKLLKTDDTLTGLGHTLHCGALLGTAGQFAQQYVEDVLVQADEVNGRILQWEGGLSVTGLLLTGLFRLPQAQPPLMQVQADKFTTYLLSRRTATNLKGVNILLESLLAISKSKVSPVSFTFVESPRVTVQKPELRIRISDVFGQPLAAPPTSVIAQSATRIVDDVVVLSKQALSSGKDKSEFVLHLKLEPGQYRIVLATSEEHTATVLIQVLGSISLRWLEVGLGDSDGSSSPQLIKLQHPTKLSKTLTADVAQHLLVRFDLSQTVHQAFLRVSSDNREIIFVAEQDSNKIYKADINLAAKLSFSGTFHLELIIGDSLISNPIQWQFGTIEVNLLKSAPVKPVVHGMLPEIVHQFRPAEKRPPQTVSTLFTALAGAPLLLLFALWFKLGINFSNFTFDALPFHIGLGSIFGLFSLFWLKLDMFTTCGWLMPIAGFTFLTGHHILSKLAKKKKSN